MELLYLAPFPRYMFFAFYTEFQDGFRKWQENNFGQILASDSAYTLQIKNFIEMAVSHIISEINVFLYFKQKFNMGIKSGGKTIFGKSFRKLYTYPVGQNFAKMTLSHPVSKIKRFVHFHHCKIQKIAITHLATYFKTGTILQVQRD